MTDELTFEQAREELETIVREARGRPHVSRRRSAVVGARRAAPRAVPGKARSGRDASRRTGGPDGATAGRNRTAPAVPTITGNSPNGTNKPSVFVAISKDPKGSGVASYSYEVATQTGWGQETTGKTVTIKAEGSTSVRFRARDKAGNFSAWGQAGTWIDTVKPQAPETPIENASGVGVRHHSRYLDRPVPGHRRQGLPVPVRPRLRGHDHLWNAHNLAFREPLHVEHRR